MSKRHATVEDAPKLRLPTRLRLVDDVYQSLESAILSGQIKPGERLIEARLSNELGVSRTVVREAFLMLERQGLVVNNPRGGTFVTRLSQQEAYDLGYMRALLESFAVTVGHERIDEHIVSRLKSCIADMSSCRLPMEVPRLVHIDLAFHHILVDSAGSARLLDLWSSLNGQIGALYIRGLESQQAQIADVVELHEELLKSVCALDVAIGQRAVFEHYVRRPQADRSADAAILLAINAIAPSYADEFGDRMLGVHSSGIAEDQIQMRTKGDAHASK
ncbi:MAG: GntR family transcriptional regulator [Herpetosiphonaceae bacterium]|nr:GntR family transcriptional regulator [Herpetosiphonaceae bacterium]